MDGPLQEADVPALKLVQLRLALQERGLDDTGEKGELAVRLAAAIGAVGSKRRLEAAAFEEHEPLAKQRHIQNADEDADSCGPPIPAAENADEEFGPQIPSAPAAAQAVAPPKRRKGWITLARLLNALDGLSAVLPRKSAALVDEPLYLAVLPSAALYERSYMHRDTVTHIVVAPRLDYVITGSSDGVLKFWKKVPGDAEFVKAYKAHLGPLAALCLGADAARLCSVGAEDRALKVYDVLNFDMVDTLALPFAPGTAAWIYKRSSPAPLVAVTDRHGPAIHIYHAERLAGGPVHTIAALHTAPVTVLAYVEAAHTAVSGDARGVLEYWSASPEDDFAPPTAAAATAAGGSSSSVVSFAFKSDTSLFDVAKAKAAPTALAVAPDGTHFAVAATDRKVRLFAFRTGRVTRVYDEALEVYEASQARATAAAAAGGPPVPMPDFAKRAAAERDLQATSLAAIKAYTSAPAAAAASGGSSSGGGGIDKEKPAYRPPPSNVAFDESGHFLVYPTLAGIKVVNTTSNRVVALLGRGEGAGDRFLCVALYQGAPRVSSQYGLIRAEAAAAAAAAGGSATLAARQQQAVSASATSAMGSAEDVADPTVFAAAFRRNRFYMFTRREPTEGVSSSSVRHATAGRDVYNEPPSREDLVLASEASAALQRARLGHAAVIHTAMGDVALKLLPALAPKAVENFCVHARAGYFNGLLFHRVIPDFMVQTGDPGGDGTGGASIWGAPFADETDRSVRFDRPGVLAMANAGPCTNGSQFFITTAACSWLDGKHTIFGHVTGSMDAVKAIEAVPTMRGDKPVRDVKIISVDIRS